MAIGGEDLLTQIENDNPKLGQYLRRYVKTAIETTARNVAVSATSKIKPPQPPESVNVTTAGEMLQIQVDHNAPIQKGVHYIYSIATNPQFINAQVEVKPATRAPFHVTLPTKNGAGDAHQFYVAVQAQYPGSDPSQPTYHGGGEPAAIALAGTTQLDILAGTGSGTAQNGGQTLVGIGKSQTRLGKK